MVWPAARVSRRDRRNAIGMGVVLHEHLAEPAAEELAVVEGEQPLQVVGADHCEVGGANLRRLLEHRFVDSPRAVSTSSAEKSSEASLA